MRDRSTSSRLHRLDELRGLLNAREHVTAADLASELRVSLRTVRRDLEILRESGMPVESDRGRGGGLRLHRDWSAGRLHLTPAEAVDLLLSVAVAEQMNSPVLLQHLAAIRRKIAAAFAQPHQSKIRSLRNRVLIGKPASDRIAASYKPLRRMQTAITDAFFNMRCMAIEYTDEKGRVTTRTIEPQFLYLSLPVWYLLAWDRFRDAIRYFRIDRITSARPLDTTFRLADPAPFLAQAEKGIAAL